MDFRHMQAWWFVLCESRDVGRKPRSFQLLGREVVVYRGESGRVRAFLDLCPHRNVRLSEGRLCAGRLVCAFHGWEFDEDGRCVKVPGMTPRPDPGAPGLKRYEVVEQAGLVFVRPGGVPTDRRPHLPPHLSDPALSTHAHRAHLRASAIDVAENFLDPFHTPFVHAGLIRTASQPNRNHVAPRHLEDGLEVVYTKERRQSGFVARFGRPTDLEMGRFLMPGIVELEYRARGELEFINTMYVTPRTQASSSLYFRAALRPSWIPPAVVWAMAGLAIKAVLRQDQAVLERQTRRAEELGGRFYACTELDIVRRQLEHLYAGDGLRVDFQPLEVLI